MTRLSALAFATALMIGEAHAQRKTPMFYTGNQLDEICRSSAPQLCSGYVAAIVDVLANDNSVNGFRACLPRRGITVDKVTNVVRQYLERNPKERHLAAVGLVAEALSQAFPCNK